MTEPNPPSSSASSTSTAGTPDTSLDASLDASLAAARPSLLGRLVEPHPCIEEVGTRHLVRLLCSFLLALSVLATMIVLFSAWQLEGITWLWALFYMALLVASYATSRSRHYIWAARVATAVLCLMPIVSTYSIEIAQPTGQLDNTTWLLLGIVFGNLYFSTRVMACVALACMAGVALVGMSLPHAGFKETMGIEWLLLFVSALVLISGRALRIVERDRLALLDRRRRELAALNQSMETMLYVISHDLKEPLRSIHGFSDTVSRKYASQLDDKGKDYLGRVVRGAERMRGLLDDIVQLLRAQRIVPPREDTPAQAMVDAVLARLAARIEETRARIDVAPGLPPLRVAPTWGVIALRSLVENALKYTSDQAPPEIEIAAYHQGAAVGLVVRDRGPGVPEQYAEKIFELFQRAVGRDVPGTGAGLAIVRQITRRHGGDAWVRPRAGGGSEFVITFRGRAGSEPGGPDTGAPHGGGDDSGGDDTGEDSGLWDPPPQKKTARTEAARPDTDTQARVRVHGFSLRRLPHQPMWAMKRYE